MRRNLKRIPILIAVFSTFTILLSSSFGLQINQGAWAGTFAGENGKIAFSSTRDGSQEIYVMNAEDGSEQTRLTNVDPDDPLLGNKADPSWSPDAQEIAFVHNNNEIYVMNAEDGSDRRPLSNDLTPKRHPAWSPDGTKIAFDHPTATSSRFDIYVMNAGDGSDVTNISNNPSSHDQTPNWSPDGTKIAFTSDRDGNNEIYVMNAEDGSEQTRLTNSPGSDEFPDWSPDGTKIAFASLRDGNWEIYVMNAEDGSELTRLTNHASDDVQVDWAPDGTKIAFTSNRDGNQQIYVMNPDGSNPTRLTDGPGSNTVPDWGTVSTSTEPPPTPSEAIEQLISDVENLEGIPQGTKTSLTAPLREASDILNDDNPENDVSACGRLDAFINQVNANERRGSLTAIQADDLRTQAEDVRSELDC